MCKLRLVSYSCLPQLVLLSERNAHRVSVSYKFGTKITVFHAIEEYAVGLILNTKLAMYGKESR